MGYRRWKPYISGWTPRLKFHFEWIILDCCHPLRTNYAKLSGSYLQRFGLATYIPSSDHPVGNFSPEAVEVRQSELSAACVVFRGDLLNLDLISAGKLPGRALERANISIQSHAMQTNLYILVVDIFSGYAIRRS